MEESRHPNPSFTRMPPPITGSTSLTALRKGNNIPLAEKLCTSEERNPMKTATHFRIPVFSIGLAVLFFAATALAQTQCVVTNGVKYLQPPNLSGYDISDGLGYVLADDFVCTNTGPITDIHIWGSWLHDVHSAVTNFIIGIYSDVPAGTNAAGAPTPSHPGGLLWSESFSTGQFSESIYTVGQEQFISPASVDIIGPDTNVWFYCFYPTNPFTQTGSAALPTVYWLAVYAQGLFGGAIANPPQFGWKTTPSIRNDVSVNTQWTGSLPPAGAPWNTNSTPGNSPIGAQPLDLAFVLTTATNNQPPPCCPDTNDTVKYVQPPNLDSGIDVDAANIRGGVLADDFPCTTTGPITDIHLWGSWMDDLFDPNATFMLSIWSDVPASPLGGFSHPGILLWSQTYGPGDYTVCPYTMVPELFADPGSPLVPFGGSTNLHYLCFNAFPTNVFVQTGTPNAPTNFWLSVSEIPGPGTSHPFYFGWKTSSTNYNDTAVSSLNVPFPPPTAWNPLTTPQGGPVNFAFKIDTMTNTPPPVSCMESNGVKYVQWPNLTNGLDVWDSNVLPSGGQGDGPWWLADDWVCTNSGEISDIHLWGSWQNDLAAPGTITFELYVLNDVPVGPNNPFYSHPGTNILWHQTFPPGTYSESIWNANAQEHFFDPGNSETLGPDTVVWYYCFNPTNLVQYGSTNNPQMYWLAAFADLPVGTPYVFGWKSTTNVQHDISVHTKWTAFSVPPTNSLAWVTNDIFFPASGSNAPFDLSFKLTTPTNCCPITITNIFTNRVVITWGCGILQAATNAAGPYLDVVGAMSPYTNSATIPPSTFYRAKCN